MARDSNLRHIAKVRPGWPLLYLHHKASQSSRQSQHGSPELSVSFGNSKQTELKTTKPLKVGNQGFTHSRQFQAPTSATPSCLYLQSRRQSRPQLPLPSRIRKSPHRPRRFSLSRGLRNLKFLGCFGALGGGVVGMSAFVKEAFKTNQTHPLLLLSCLYNPQIREIHGPGGKAPQAWAKLGRRLQDSSTRHIPEPSGPAQRCTRPTWRNS